MNDERAPRAPGEPARPPDREFALWRLGFRPFYLVASIFAAASVPLWALQYAGYLPHPYLSASVFHAHEMIFGFAAAVVTGFLFTAVRNWTSLTTPSGWLLGGIVALWVLGRGLVLTPWTSISVIVNTVFLLSAAAGIGVPIVKSRNRRNYFFVVALVFLATAELGFGLSVLNVISFPAWLSARLGLDIILFLVAVMAGRVVPMFTNNGVRGANARRHPWVERASLGAILALLAADATQLTGPVVNTLLVVAALLHLARLLMWQPWKTVHTPLVWVLHLAYAWIPVHFILRCLADAERVVPFLATHALTIGVIGTMTLGMMTRTALGHTGRTLIAGTVELWCYLLVTAAAITRVFMPMLEPSAYRETVLLSAVFWSAAYGLYAVGYWPILTRARVDGKPG